MRDLKSRLRFSVLTLPRNVDDYLHDAERLNMKLSHALLKRVYSEFDRVSCHDEEAEVPEQCVVDAAKDLQEVPFFSSFSYGGRLFRKELRW
jgi:hypothetical protein